MRVLAIIDTLALGGGAERLVVSLVPELARLGVRVDVVSLVATPTDLGDELEAQGFSVRRLAVASPWAMASILPSLAKIVRQGDYDLVWGHLFFGNLYASLATLVGRTKRAVTTHHSPVHFNQSWKSRLLAQVQKRVVSRLAAQTVAVSGGLANEYARLLAWTRPAVIHNGVCLHSLRAASANRELTAAMRKKYRGAEFTILVPARLVPAKGHKYLLEALQQLEVQHGWQPRLVLLGSGCEKPGLVSQARALGIDSRVKFFDAIPQAELFALMSVVDVVVLPSLREPFGLAAAEAMALGRPTILTRVGGFMEIVGDSHSALLIEPENSAAMADALWCVHRDVAQMRRMRTHARRRIRERFDIRECAASWARLFASVGVALPSPDRREAEIYKMPAVARPAVSLAGECRASAAQIQS